MIKVIVSISSSYTHLAQFVQELVKNASKFTSQSQLFTGVSIPALELTQCKVILNFCSINNCFAVHGQKATIQQLVVNSCANPNPRP